MQTYFMEKDFDKLHHLLNDVKEKIEEEIKITFMRTISNDLKTFEFINMLEALYRSDSSIDRFNLMFSRCFVYIETDRLVLQFIDLTQDLKDYISTLIEKADHEKIRKELDKTLDLPAEEYVDWTQWQQNLFEDFQMMEKEDKKDCLIFYFYNTDSSYRISFQTREERLLSEFFNNLEPEKISFCIQDREDLELSQVFFAIEEDFIKQNLKDEIDYERSSGKYAVDLSLINGKVNDLLFSLSNDLEYEDEVWSISTDIKNDIIEKIKEIGFNYSDELLNQIERSKENEEINCN